MRSDVTPPTEVIIPDLGPKNTMHARHRHGDGSAGRGTVLVLYSAKFVAFGKQRQNFGAFLGLTKKYHASRNRKKVPTFLKMLTMDVALSLGGTHCMKGGAVRIFYVSAVAFFGHLQ